jgi:hypothetical protein
MSILEIAPAVGMLLETYFGHIGGIFLAPRSDFFEQHDEILTPAL